MSFEASVRITWGIGLRRERSPVACVRVSSRWTGVTVSFGHLGLVCEENGMGFVC